MLRIASLAPIALASLGLLAFGSIPAKTENVDPVHLVGHVNATALNAYLLDDALLVLPQLQAAGGEVLAAAPTPPMLEGMSAETWSVSVRFPSEAAFASWSVSEEYQALEGKGPEAVGHDRSAPGKS